MKRLISSLRAECYNNTHVLQAKPPARRDFYKIWLVENDCTISCADSTITINQPSLVFLHPSVLYSLQSTAPERSGYWVIFTEDLLLDLHTPIRVLFQPYRPIVIPQTSCMLERTKFIFQGIVDEYHSEYRYSHEIIRSNVYLLMHEGLKHQSVNEPDNKIETATQRITLQFLHLLENQFPITSCQEPLQMKKPAAFAQNLAVHVNHLNAVVKEATGKSTSQHIVERIIAESQALLKFSDWTVAEIAYSLGFEYPNHFTAFFKKHTRRKPLELRK